MTTVATVMLMRPNCLSYTKLYMSFGGSEQLILGIMFQGHPSTDKKRFIVKVPGPKTLQAVAVAVSFALTAYSIFQDRAAVATVAATFTLALSLFMQLERFESFESFEILGGLKAKLRERIETADQLINLIARIAYMQVSHMGRFSSPSWSVRLDIVQRVEAALSARKNNEPSATAERRLFSNTVAADLLRLLPQQLSSEYRRELLSKKGWSVNFTQSADLMSEVQTRATALFEIGDFSDAELESLKQVRDEIVTLANACVKSGVITAETAAYLDRHGPF